MLLTIKIKISLSYFPEIIQRGYGDDDITHRPEEA